MSSNVAIRQIFDDALEESEIRQAARIEQIINDAIASALKAPSAPRAPPLSLPDAQRELGGFLAGSSIGSPNCTSLNSSESANWSG